MKTCSRCGEEKSLDLFHKRSARKSGYASHCKTCDSNRTKQWREENPETASARFIRWKAANPERAIERVKVWKLENPSATKEAHRRKAHRRRLQINATKEFYTERQVLDTYGYSCYLCNEAINFLAPRSAGKKGWERGLHIDHVIPLSKGGSDTLENVRPTHGKCNLKKSNSML